MAYFNRATNNEPDYYAILGLQVGSTEAQIKKAYRQKAKECHPDKNPNDKQAAAKFIKLKEAFDFLSGEFL